MKALEPHLMRMTAQSPRYSKEPSPQPRIVQERYRSRTTLGHRATVVADESARRAERLRADIAGCERLNDPSDVGADQPSYIAGVAYPGAAPGAFDQTVVVPTRPPTGAFP
jgi:hypothetical protein